MGDNSREIKDSYSMQFEKEIPSKERHLKGQYFTHGEIVDFILDNIPVSKTNKFLDPTCGAGAFLGRLNTKGVPINNLYGSDIDPRALELCSKNLGESENLVEGDFIKDVLFNDNFFDVIIGNPPFQNLSKKEKKFPEGHKHFVDIGSGIMNSASLVLARSYYLLKEGGYLGLVLPKNLVRVDSFKGIRNFIIDKFQIILIKDLDHHFKDVRCDQIVLIARKIKPNTEEKIKIITYKKGLSFLKQKSYFIYQKELKNYSFFPIFYDEPVKKIADKLLNIKKTLSNESDIFRGESIDFFKKNISEVQTNRILLRGNCIERFGIKNKLYLKEKGLSSSKVKKMRNKKIVIQNIASKEGGIFPFVSSHGELTMDTITNIIPKKEEYLKFLTCLLGSKLTNFFMIHVIYLNSNFSMHTDKAYIGKIPIIYPNELALEEINLIYDKLSKIKDKYSYEFKEEYEKLNKIIFSLYKLKVKEINVIKSSLKEVMSKKHG